MIVLDTNVFAELMRAADDRNAHVDAWFDSQDANQLHLPAQVLFETKFGIEVQPSGRRKRQREATLARLLDLGFKERIVPFDGRAATVAAEIEARRKASGRPAGVIDAMIAGIAVSNGASLATRNTKHFADLPVRIIDPWQKQS